MLHRLLILLACSCATLLCGFGQPGAQAQSLGIMPAMVDAKVKGGATYTQEYTISNGTSARLRLRCSVGDFWYDEQNRRVDGLPGTLPRSASPWVQFSPAETTIEPQSSVTVKAIITVPAAATGGFYTTPIFEAEEDLTTRQPGAVSASIKVRIRALMLLATEGSSEYNVEVMGGRAVPPTSSSPLEMQLDLRNRGTAHAGVRGIFAILNAAGVVAGHGRIEEQRYLPGQRATSKARWAGELAPGHYTAIVTLTYNRAGMEPNSLVSEIPFDVK